MHLLFQIEMVKNIDVEGLHWDITLRELITTFQYSERGIKMA